MTQQEIVTIIAKTMVSSGYSEDDAYCRYCDKPVSQDQLTTTTAYWRIPGTANQPKYYCHIACKKEGYLREAYDCQTIDADCNDCIHFQRSTGEDRTLGTCLRYGKSTRGHAQLASLLPCFEHRRAGEYA